MMATTKKDFIFLIFILGFACYFVFNNFLTMPRVGWDEGMNLQLARNLAEFGRWQIQISPGVFSNSSHFYSTGWTTLIPIGFFFRIFGPSFFVARLVMAFYLLGFLVISFLLMRHWFGARRALFSASLLAAFAPVYAYGKPALGEIPSLFWLGAALFFFEKTKGKKDGKQAVLAGILFGLAAASKLTYVILFTPALFLALLVFSFKEEINLKWLAVFAAGFIAVVSPDVWFSFLRPAFHVGFGEVLDFYSNNYASECVSCDVKNNLFRLISEKSLIYTLLLLVVSVFALTKEKIGGKKIPWFVYVAVLYGGASLLYFLKSPGTARYLFPLQTLLIFSLPVSLNIITKFLANRFYFLKSSGAIVTAVLFCFLFLHTVHICLSGYASSSASPILLEKYLKNELPPYGAVGVINLPSAPVAIDSGRLINYMRIDNKDKRFEGVNPLVSPENNLPKFIVYDNSNKKNDLDIGFFRDKIEKNYKQTVIFGSYIIMQKNNEY